VKKLIALLIGIVFVGGLSGSALAQSTTTTPAPKDDKKMEKPAGEMTKKPAGHSANGTVKSAASDSIVVAGKAKAGKEAEWTVSVDPKTKIRKGGKDITAADLTAGDNVNVRYHEDAGKNVADTVMVRAAKKPADTSAAAPKPAEPKK
jgi:hypothetical protein